MLAVPVVPYRALYRLSCCGRRDLLAALRGDADSLHVSVAAPPGGVILEAWVAGDSGVLLDGERRCRVALPAGRLPLTSELSLPLAPAMLAVLASGRVPEGAVPIEARPGWVRAPVGGGWLHARVGGSPPRLSAVEISDEQGSEARLAAVLTAHRGLVPGVLDVRAGGRTLLLELQVWEQGTPPAPPGWLTRPVCEGEP